MGGIFGFGFDYKFLRHSVLSVSLESSRDIENKEAHPIEYQTIGGWVE